MRQSLFRRPEFHSPQPCAGLEAASAAERLMPPVHRRAVGLAVVRRVGRAGPAQRWPALVFPRRLALRFGSASKSASRARYSSNSPCFFEINWSICAKAISSGTSKAGFPGKSDSSLFVLARCRRRRRPSVQTGLGLPARFWRNLFPVSPVDNTPALLP